MSMTRRSLVLCLAAVSLACSSAEQAQPGPAVSAAAKDLGDSSRALSTAAIRNPAADSALVVIREKGMRNFVDSLYDRDHAGFRRMMDGIGSGDSLWLEVARELRWSGNTELGESLVDVLGTEALLRAPRLVLRLAMDSTTFGSKICTPSFYEGDADSLVARITGEARQALSSVTEPELRELRDQCLSYLQ